MTGKPEVGQRAVNLTQKSPTLPGSPVLSVAALPPLLNGVNITSDLIKVRKIVTGEQSQHHAQGLQASLIVLAGALQILR